MILGVPQPFWEGKLTFHNKLCPVKGEPEVNIPSGAKRVLEPVLLGNALLFSSFRTRDPAGL